MKAERYQELQKTRRYLSASMDISASMDMGFAPGGRMRQEIYDDPYGLDAWDQRHFSRCFVTIANSTAWEAISDEHPPTEPPTAKLYTAAGLPWFEYYGADAKALKGAEKLKHLKSVTAKGREKGVKSLPEHDPVEIDQLLSVRKQTSDRSGKCEGEANSRVRVLSKLACGSCQSFRGIDRKSDR